MRTILVLGCLLALSGVVVAADVKTRDIIFYDAKAKKDESIKDAVIQEQTPGGITIKPRTGAVRKIAAEDIRFIDFDTDKVDALSWRKHYGEEVVARNATKDTEKLAKYQEALKTVADLETKVATVPEALAYLHYKKAAIKYQISRLDAAKTDEAVESLTKFKTDHKEGWTIGMALRMLAEMQRDRGDLKGVEQTYQELAGIKGLPPEMGWECEMQLATVMLETNRVAAAETKLKSLVASLPPDHAFRERASIGLLRCQIAGANAGQAEKELRAYLVKTKDPIIKGLVHNTLGDYYLKNNKAEEAFWEYLKVDTLYNDEKIEHAKALYNLSILFRTVKMKNIERADACKDQLLKDKRFDGLEYQKKAREQK